MSASRGGNAGRFIPIYGETAFQEHRAAQWPKNAIERAVFAPREGLNNRSPRGIALINLLNGLAGEGAPEIDVAHPADVAVKVDFAPP